MKPIYSIFRSNLTLSNMNFRLLVRHLSNQSKGSISQRIALSKDETCFVAYHPDKDYPYEFTKPLPSKEDASIDDRLLKVDSHNMITKAPNLEQLQNLTYTPARYWREYQGRDKRTKYQNYFNDNVDRKGLTS